MILLVPLLMALAAAALVMVRRASFSALEVNVDFEVAAAFLLR